MGACSFRWGDWIGAAYQKRYLSANWIRRASSATVILPASAAPMVSPGVSKMRCVGQVERFEAKLQLMALPRHREISCNQEIEVLPARSVDQVAAGIAESPGRTCHNKPSIEPSIHGALRLRKVGISDLVATVGAERVLCIGHDCVGERRAGE